VKLRAGFIAALAVMAIGGVSVANATASKLGIKLVCVDSPCGTNPTNNTYHGVYLVEKTEGLPAHAKVVITATYPSGKSYPVDQYSYPGTLYGVQGNVEKTDADGQLPDFKWAGVNNNAPVDPPGLYHLTFCFKKGGEIVTIKVPMRLRNLS
jgi:hypothetical protein